MVLDRREQDCRETGKVTALNMVERTVDVCIDEQAGLVLYDCRLNAIVDTYASHLLVAPALGSIVTVERQRKGIYAVVSYSEIDSVDIRIGTTEVAIGADGVVLNGGMNGGMVNVQVLQDNMDNIKKYCERIRSAVESGLTAVGAGTAANGATGASGFAQAMGSASIQLKTMNDDKIKH